MANTTPIFPLVPEISFVTLFNETTDRSGATVVNLLELLTAGASGTKITQIVLKSAGATGGGSVLIFITDAAGNNPTLFDELVFNALTPAEDISSTRGVGVYSDLQLKPGQKILVGVTVFQQFGINIFAVKGDY